MLKTATCQGAKILCCSPFILF